jgi:hypothetical protein
MSVIRRLIPLLFVCLLFASPARDSAAQDMGIRFGVGFNTMLSTADGLGVGFRSRLSTPVNPDLSVALDLGATGFIFQGRDAATYVIDPQVSFIVSLPMQGDRLPYVIAGLGAYLPTESDAFSGPTLQGGFGYVHLLHETSIFYEVNPALIIGRDRVHLALPFRVGFIF